MLTTTVRPPVFVHACDRRRAIQTLPPVHPNLAAPTLRVWALHVRYERCREDAVRDALFDQYAGYARALARTMHRNGAEPLDDLEQVAYSAMLAALARFETARRLPFEAFARPTILGSLKRHYRDLGWSVRVPRRVHEAVAPMRATVDRLTQQLGRTPDPDEVAAELGIDAREVADVTEAVRQRSTLAMDAPRHDVGSSEDHWTEVGDADPAFNATDDHVALTHAMATLDERDRSLLCMYFWEERTQVEIAQGLGVSQMHVSRRLANLLARLRTSCAA